MIWGFKSTPLLAIAETAVKSCSGVTAMLCPIAIVPMFIAQGGHLKNDVPKLLDELRNAHPDVRFVLGPPVGEAEAIVQAMADYAVGLADAF